MALTRAKLEELAPAWVKSATKPPYSWEEIGGRPEVLPSPGQFGAGTGEYTGIYVVFDEKILLESSGGIDRAIYLRIEGISMGGTAGAVFAIAQVYWQRINGWARAYHRNLGYPIGATKFFVTENNNLGVYFSNLPSWSYLFVTARVNSIPLIKLSHEFTSTEPSGSNKITCTLL